MNTALFRKTSLDRVNSPEQLNQYIQVVNPSVWVMLGAVILLLIGVVIWGVFGTITTAIPTGAAVTDGAAVCYLAEEDAKRVVPGMPIEVGGVPGTVDEVAPAPDVLAAEDPYLLYLCGLEPGDLSRRVTVEGLVLANGVYEAAVTVDSLRPITLVIH